MEYLARLYLILLVLFGGTEQACATDDYARQRAALLRDIEADVRATADYLERDTLDERVLAAMRSVPRHEFVPERERQYAYENRPLPIGYGQTISQPYIVAIMTDLLDLQSGDRVLEIGTGSGYQAAVLAELSTAVYSIEIVPELAGRAAKVLDRLNYSTRITTRIGDGYFGWQEQAPFDAIVVTAAADHVPPPLIKQLKPGGRMLIPVGSRFLTQQLVLVEKSADGEVTTRLLLPVRFVPLTGER
jgi:protein-L-isoaspartate(D-aspartate) O-methyltransferase